MFILISAACAEQSLEAFTQIPGRICHVCSAVGVMKKGDDVTFPLHTDTCHIWESWKGEEVELHTQEMSRSVGCVSRSEAWLCKTFKRVEIVELAVCQRSGDGSGCSNC
jgi:hypothetical protein